MGRIKDVDIELKLYSNSSINSDYNSYYGPEELSEGISAKGFRSAEYEFYRNRMEIANRIIELRKKAGLKQCELAALLGMSGPQLSYYENGRGDFPIGMLFEIAQIFAPIPGVSLDYIILGKSPAIIDKKIADILKGKSFEEKEQAVKLLKVHFGMD